MSRIYVYETSHSKKQLWEINDVKGKGLIKIGITTTTAEERINDQMQGYPCTQEKPYDILLDVPAKTIVGKPFRDSDIHNILVQWGFYRLQGTEWFGCTVDDVKRAIEQINKTPYMGDCTLAKIKKVLSENKCGLTDRQIADKLNLPVSTVRSAIYGRAAQKRCFFKRSKRYNKALRKSVYYYTASYTLNPPKKPKIDVPEWMTPRDQKFIVTYKISLDDIVNALHNHSLSESCSILAQKTGVKESTIEKLLLRVRKQLVERGYLIMENHKHYIP